MKIVVSEAAAENAVGRRGSGKKPPRELEVGVRLVQVNCAGLITPIMVLSSPEKRDGVMQLRLMNLSARQLCSYKRWLANPKHGFQSLANIGVMSHDLGTEGWAWSKMDYTFDPTTFLELLREREIELDDLDTWGAERLLQVKNIRKL